MEYSVYTTNTNTQQRTRIDIYPSSDSHTIQDTPSDCHTLLFEVFAENSVGTSTTGEVSGGFPVAVSEFQVDTSVAFKQQDLIPHVSFHVSFIATCIHARYFTPTYVLSLECQQPIFWK